jgi:hypothetical protein
MQQSQNNTVGFKYLLEKRKKLLLGQRQKSMQTPQKKPPKKIRSMVEAICRTKLWRADGRAGGGLGGKTEKRRRRRKNKKGLLRLDLMIKSTVANGSKIRGK